MPELDELLELEGRSDSGLPELDELLELEGRSDTGLPELEELLELKGCSEVTPAITDGVKKQTAQATKSVRDNSRLSRDNLKTHPTSVVCKLLDTLDGENNLVLIGYTYIVKRKIAYQNLIPVS